MKHWLLIIAAFAVAAMTPASAQLDTLCAEVKMEVAQEATIERQAFDAQMRIRNGLPSTPITDVNINIWIEDLDGNTISYTSDPNNTSAFFFVASPILTSVNTIEGTGTVAAATTAQINWLIIPASGAAGSTALGRQYYVGANFTYKINGLDQDIDVAPDFIFVRPLPRLILDYFLPGDVVGDDTLTPAVESVVPFALGLRVNNDGFGAANNLSVDSAQPDIVENELGLLVSFEIISSEVNGAPATESLRVDFGDIEGGDTGVAKWWMTASLSGTFSNFNAEFTHADEYGGLLTSLIDDIFTHTLLHPVIVDLPGRDRICDFLVDEGASYRVYESAGTDSAVSDSSGSGTFTALTSLNDVQIYDLTVPAAGGPFYAKFDYPNPPSNVVVVSIVRDDGKRIDPANTWVSQTRATLTNSFKYFFNLFDANGGGTYTVTLSDDLLIPRPPAIASVGDKVVIVSNLLQFVVVANDTNGTIPTLVSTPLPGGATFTTSNINLDIKGTFDWTPQPGQEGVHPVRFTASDGSLSDEEQVKVYVGAIGESLNSNGIPESLEDWAVRITDLYARSDSGTSTVKWESVQGILYDVYYSDQAFSSGMVWQILATNVEAAAAEETISDDALGLGTSRRFYEVLLRGDTPGVNEVWGLFREAVDVGYELAAHPLRSDRRFDGDLGVQLAAALTGDDGGAGDQAGDEVYIRETNGTWRVLYLDSSNTWREAGGAASTYELVEGAGFFICRHGSSNATVTLSGPVGDPNSQTNTIVPGYNIAGWAKGGAVDLIEVVDNAVSGSPVGAATEETADLLIIEKPDGRWQRLMYVEGWGASYDGKWIDLDTGQEASPQVDPGQAVYYFRQGGSGNMEVVF